MRRIFNPKFSLISFSNIPPLIDDSRKQKTFCKLQAGLELCFFIYVVEHQIMYLDMLKQPRLRSQAKSRYVQTIPDGKCPFPDRPRHSQCPDFCAFTKFSCVELQIFGRSSDHLCVHMQIFVCPPDVRALMSRLS